MLAQRSWLFHSVYYATTFRNIKLHSLSYFLTSAARDVTLIAMSDPLPSPRKKWYSFTWRGPGKRWLLLFSLLIIGGLLMVLLAAAAGAGRGVQDRQAALQAEVAQLLSSAAAHRQAGETALAAADFQRVLQLDPANTTAQQALQTLHPPTPEAVASVEPLLLVPPGDATPPPAADALPTDTLYKHAQAALDKRDWETAISLLNQLATLAPAYQADNVRAMRFQAYSEQAQGFVDQERYEEALRAYDQALVIRPNDTRVTTQRELIALYVDVLGRWRLDWPGVVNTLLAIQTLQPNFLDVDKRLPAAYLAWGDAMMEDNQWCDAVAPYESALNLSGAATLQEKLTQAQATCANPPLIDTAGITNTIPITGSVTPARANGQGRLTLATYDTQFNRWNLFRLSAKGGQPQLVVQDISQSAASPDGTFLAARSEQGDQAGLVVMSAGGGEARRLTTFAEDAHPRWSGDGSELIFESTREVDRRWRIYTVSAGGGEGAFLDFGRWPAWSPRSPLIVYQGCIAATGRCGLLLANPAGGDVRQLTDVPGDSMPVWSPDGARVAFASADRGGSWDIFIVDLNSGNVASLAPDAAVDAHPVWSPDGRQIAFLSNRDGSWAVYLAGVAGGQSQKLVAVPGSIPDWYEMQLDWSW